MPDEDASVKPMLGLTGKAGDGKTMLLGKLALDIEVNLLFSDLFFDFYSIGTNERQISVLLLFS
jgi:hypothetical protein